MCVSLPQGQHLHVGSLFEESGEGVFLSQLAVWKPRASELTALKHRVERFLPEEALWQLEHAHLVRKDVQQEVVVERGGIHGQMQQQVAPGVWHVPEEWLTEVGGVVPVEAHLELDAVDPRWWHQHVERRAGPR
eukprot:CAMPEP_0177676546 /NCGR_PEP_ID=MMETSP0447-20121125/27856_1 /TAXON_ID=0 /ORGANISM="Stygamoeba regulata, Strain BSH-02190019" /LENGTH=133 /DNA_ID=CAMNT_0019185135 /DNA_START=171 /DNA_END=569 /DNA_ORIENTATION=+